MRTEPRASRYLRATALARGTIPVLLVSGAIACGPIATAGPGCSPVRTGLALPPELKESSGVAVSLRHPGIFWTHNDAGSALFAVDSEGAILRRYLLDRRLRDWEDIAVSMCADGGSCLYMADLGDNYEERQTQNHPINLLRTVEPDPSDRASGDTLQTEAFPVRLPDGERDIEAMMVLPGERIYFVTKGRNHAVTVYRYPPPLRPDTVVLEEVQRLTERARILPRQVTGGAVSPRGGVLALRTYGVLQFYLMAGDTLAVMEDGLVNLRTLQEAQGEGVGIGLDGQVVLTSEGGPVGGPGGMTFLRCDLPGL